MLHCRNATGADLGRNKAKVRRRAEGCSSSARCCDLGGCRPRCLRRPATPSRLGSLPNVSGGSVFAQTTQWLSEAGGAEE